MESGIVKKAALGDTEALSRLVDETKDIAFNLALSIVKNEDDAKDILQDSFLKVLENLAKFRNEARFTTWLYRIVYNHSIQFIQGTKRREKIHTEHHEYGHPDQYNSESDESKYKTLNAAIEQLEEPERSVIMLFYLAEQTIKKISVITGLSVPNIKVILHRARKKLYQKLKRTYEKI